MKKLLVIGTLAISMSYMTSSYAEPATASVAAGSAVVAEGVMAAEGAAMIAGATAAGMAAAIASPVVGAGLGAATAKVMNDKIFTDCENQQKACDAAQIGTYTGAGVGTLAAIGAVVMEGLSTAGLVSIGSVVGGGALAGAATLVAAPIVLAVAGGGLAYLWITYSEEEEIAAVSETE
ncbi:MAG: hypothetical protein KAH84_03375 [Thiomargarita sp.]|nr:hypothetical protein [Thiomargarita sp.]